VLERLKEGGMPVGLLEFARYTEGTIDLGSGDLLVCVSDGITEAVNTAGEIWDESGVEKVLKQTAGRPAAEFIECMVGAADAYATGAEQADDMTLVALRVL
jgi:sigma-B regulation protein RsbU (phosphoserine phosphatase)